MKTVDQDATLGRPSLVWRFGQERRLALVRRHVSLEGKVILDVACGVGMYMQAFLRYTPHVYGTEIELERAKESCRIVPHVAVAAAEYLPYAANSFDVAFMHEMIEHVEDDRQTIAEAYRVLRPGGYMVIFAPNRLFPFETHGIYWGKRYICGNIPLVNYLPDPLRNKLVHHARAYTARGIKRLFDGLDVEFLVFTQIYPGFDKFTARHSKTARIFRKVLYFAETTPMRAFGLSHFVVARVLS